MNSSLYLERYAYPDELLPDYVPPEDTGIIVVIPSYKEPQVERAVQALLACEKPQCSVIIIVVFNESEQENPENSHKNLQGIAKLQSIKSDNLLILHEKLPAKKAGVGLARKIGMDEAVRLFHKINTDGVIVCFDADCTCAANYLQEIERTYAQQEVNAAIVFYEHVLGGVHHQEIVQYELYLRYYIAMLRFAGFPFAHQTLGSCITTRASVYERQGGMNTRKAGEDFYFLNKVIPLGGFREINSTTVFPSDRVSDRVPFGTGKAIMGLLEEDHYTVYHPNVFKDLKAFLSLKETIWDSDSVEFPVAVNAFFDHQLQKHIHQLKQQVGTRQQFFKRFFHWFDAFKILKFVHFARDHYYSNLPVGEAIDWLFDQVLQTESDHDQQVNLFRLRAHDRGFTIK